MYIPEKGSTDESHIRQRQARSGGEGGEQGELRGGDDRLPIGGGEQKQGRAAAVGYSQQPRVAAVGSGGSPADGSGGVAAVDWARDVGGEDHQLGATGEPSGVAAEETAIDHFVTIADRPCPLTEPKLVGTGAEIGDGVGTQPIIEEKRVRAVTAGEPSAASSSADAIGAGVADEHIRGSRTGEVEGQGAEQAGVREAGGAGVDEKKLAASSGGKAHGEWVAWLARKEWRLDGTVRITGLECCQLNLPRRGQWFPSLLPQAAQSCPGRIG